MGNLEGSVAAEQRLEWLSARLAESGVVTIVDAAAALAVSEMTIRRDLVELEARGHARRVRGGATAVGLELFARRRHRAPRAKARIAAKLAALVPATGMVAFDASSTVMRMIPELRELRDLAVVTNGPDTFQGLQSTSGVRALLTGGELEPRTGSLVGPLACWSASQLSVDVFFASCSGVDPTSGALEAALEEAEVKRSIAAAAQRVVLAADASKLNGGSGGAVGLHWEEIDVLVTDLPVSDPRLSAYRELVEIL